MFFDCLVAGSSLREICRRKWHPQVMAAIELANPHDQGKVRRLTEYSRDCHQNYFEFIYDPGRWSGWPGRSDYSNCGISIQERSIRSFRNGGRRFPGET